MGSSGDRQRTPSIMFTTLALGAMYELVWKTIFIIPEVLAKSNVEFVERKGDLFQTDKDIATPDEAK